MNEIARQRALSQHTVPVVSWDEYRQWGESIGLDEETIQSATKFLHWWGEVLHFQSSDSLTLSQQVITDPRWLIDLFRTVISFKYHADGFVLRSELELYVTPPHHHTSDTLITHLLTHSLSLSLSLSLSPGYRFSRWSSLGYPTSIYTYLFEILIYRFGILVPLTSDTDEVDAHLPSTEGYPLSSGSDTRFVAPILLHYSAQNITQPEQLDEWNIWHRAGWERETQEMELSRYMRFPFMLSGIFSRLFVALLQRTIDEEATTVGGNSHDSSNDTTDSELCTASDDVDEVDSAPVPMTARPIQRADVRSARPFFSLVSYWKDGFYVRERRPEPGMAPSRVVASLVSNPHEPYGKVMQIFVRGSQSTHQLKECHFIVQRQLQQLYPWLWNNHIEPKVDTGVAFITRDSRIEIVLNRREAIQLYLTGAKDYTKNDRTVSLVALLPEIATVEQQYPKIRVLASTFRRYRIELS